MDRRRFLIRSGQVAAAAAVAGALALDRLLGEASDTPGLRKCISLGGPGPLERVGHPDDYRLWGNREFIRDSNTAWVKLWVSWSALQQELRVAPTSRAESWRHLNTAPGGASWLRRLDAQVRAANDDGVNVMLAIYHTHPTWSNGADGPDPVNASRSAEQKLPLDLSPDGPWGWFISHLMARYDARGHDARFGNPERAHIDALEIMNEPNLLYWPQEGIARATAQMIRTAAELSHRWGSMPILAPATSDFPDEIRKNSRGITGTPWDDFTERVLTALGNFRPAVPVHWSHHNYRDVRFGNQPSRAERVIAMLRAKGWTDERPLLWLTEGGLNLGPKVDDPVRRRAQARAIERNFRRMMRVPDVYMWTQHTISDKPGNDFKTGLRDDFVWGSGPGTTRPSWQVWKELPGEGT